MSRFGHSTTGDEVVSAFASQVQGKTFLITGPSQSTVGSATALALAKGAPAHLLLAGRSLSKISPVISSINDISPSTIVSFVPLDLAKQESVRMAANDIKQKLADTKLDVLINNAGIIAGLSMEKTEDGIETTFGVNHLGHFLLTGLLMRSMAQDARIVCVTSTAFMGSDIRWNDINFKDGEEYGTLLAYAQSKTANNLHAIGLAHNYGDRGITAFSVHPGASNESRLVKGVPTEVFANAWDNYRKREAELGWSLHPGAPKNLQQMCSTTLVAALNKDLREHNGAFLIDCHVNDDIIGYAKEPESAQRLWALSEKLVGESFKP